MNNILDTIHELCKVGEYDQALTLFSSVEEKIIDNPNFFLWKGICILLSSSTTPYQLSDAEIAFRTALAKDSTFIEAWIELGWFYLNVEDDAIHASPFFQKAVELAHKQIIETGRNSELHCEQMTEAVIGEARCLIETNSKEAALKFLRQKILQEFLSREKIMAEETKIIQQAK